MTGSKGNQSHGSEPKTKKKRQKKKIYKWARDSVSLLSVFVINNGKSAFQGSYLSADGGRVLHILKKINNNNHTKNWLELLKLCWNFFQKSTRCVCATSAVASYLLIFRENGHDFPRRRCCTCRICVHFHFFEKWFHFWVCVCVCRCVCVFPFMVDKWVHSWGNFQVWFQALSDCFLLTFQTDILEGGQKK